MKSLLRRSVNRVTVPEGEILSFAQPLESIQRKGGSIAASSCAPANARQTKVKRRYCIKQQVGWAKAAPCPSCFNVVLMGTLRFAHPTTEFVNVAPIAGIRTSSQHRVQIPD